MNIGVHAYTIPEGAKQINNLLLAFRSRRR